MAASPKIVVIDYHKGNLSSVARGLARAGAEVEVSDDPPPSRADGIVLPGVGSFADAIAYMAESGQAAAVVGGDDGRDRARPFWASGVAAAVRARRRGRIPGCRYRARSTRAAAAWGRVRRSEADGSRWVRGLGVLPGSCTRLVSSRLKVPHVGWDQVPLPRRAGYPPLLERVLPRAPTCSSRIPMRSMATSSPPTSPA